MAAPPPVTQEQFAHLATVVAVCWWTICFAIIFFMQAGFQLLEGGSIRAKNVAHVGAKVMVHMAIAVTSFYLVGFAIKNFAWPLCYVLHGDGGKLLADVVDPITRYTGWRAAGGGALPWSFSASPDGYGWSFFGSLVFCITSTAIPGTVFSERFTMRGYILFSIFYTLIIYPVFGWLVWGGLSGSPLLDPHSGLLLWLDRLFTPDVDSALGKRLVEYGMAADGGGRHFYAPYTDYAGSTGVHMLGGLVGMVGAWYVGPRRGKFKDGKPQAIPAHNVPMAVFGALLLSFCWFGFNGGSVVANYFSHPTFGEGAGARGLYLADYLFSDIWWVTIVTIMAAAGGVLGSYVVGKWIFGKPDPLVIANGLLGALVGVCAGVGFMPPWYGFLVGLCCGAQFPFTLRYVEHRLKLDDAIGTIACHACSGAVGGILAGVWGQLFWWGVIPLRWVHPGAGLAGGTTIPTLAIELVGMVALVAWALPTAWITFKVIDKLVGCRVSPEDEAQGLDLAEHGIEAYPHNPNEG